MPNPFETMENSFYQRYPSGIYLFYGGVAYHQVLIIRYRCMEEQQNCYFPWYYKDKRVRIGLSLT